MDVQRILNVPENEIRFIYLKRASTHGQFDNTYRTLPVGRRGLRLWDSFEEDPEYLHEYLRRPTSCPLGWRPIVVDWCRFASSEALVLNQYQLTVIQRINIALGASHPNTSIIATPTTFTSFGPRDNKVDDDSNTRIAPDLVVLDGKPERVNGTRDFRPMVIVAGDAKLSTDREDGGDKVLPRTHACIEPYLAQPVHYCLTFGVPFGFVLTSYELVIFQLVRLDSPVGDVMRTRLSHPNISSPPSTPSDPTEESEFSSPISRQTSD
ncbi:hypothetical protein F4861DRAFT_375185 [Xylaria intraflava]|nr:hypothetical protein F4861DRAFT_375185 [Xylaria intraflava]